MESLLNIENLLTLFMLTLLQVVLGFDNLLYISIESKRVEPSKQAMLRRLGIGLAVALRIVLLFVVIKLISYFQDPFAHVDWQGVVEASFSGHSVIVLFGGIFILYTALKEIYHMMLLDDLEHEEGSSRSFAWALFWIVVMNVVFSFDSILSAIALTDVFYVMATAIMIGGVLMIWLSDRVAVFLQKNRMYEVVGLFILFIVGIMLVSEGGHLAHLKLFGYDVTPMTKTTFYFVLFIVVTIDIVQGRYKKKLMLKRQQALADKVA